MITLHLKQTFPFAQNPGIVSIKEELFFLNNVVLPRNIDMAAAYNPHNVKAWCIGNEYGSLAVVWASNEQSALDAACNLNALESLQAVKQDYNDETLTALGNASELHDLSSVWLAEVKFDAARDIQLIVQIVRSTEQGKSILDQ